MSIDIDSFLAKVELDTDRAMAAGTPGDRVLMVLSGYSDPWKTADNQAQSVSLVVPADDDFYAEYVNIYLGARKYDSTAPGGTSQATDLTFRPAMWVTTDNSVDIYDHYYAQDANATWKMTDTFNGAYQGSTGMRISTAYSARYGQGAVSSEIPLSAWPGARRFFTPRKIIRGSTVTFEITPTFGRDQNTTQYTQFRVCVVMQGHKIVRRTA